MLDCSSKPEAMLEQRRRIIAVLQDGLPISAEPYSEVALTLGISETDLLEQMRDMLDDGSIRRIGVVPNHYALGYSHNLMVVWDIEDCSVDAAGERIGALDCVSHCYRRPRLAGWPYNLFAMVHGRTDTEIEQKIALVRQQVGDGYRAHCALRSTRILKKTGLRIKSREQ